MGFLNSEGRINQDWHLIDAEMFGMRENAAIYIVENAGTRIMIDTTTPALFAKKIVKKLKRLGLYPIHKIFISHSHWDHIDAVNKLKELMKNDVEVEVIASARAVNTLENPQEMNLKYEVNVAPINPVIALKEGDIIDLGDLELQIFEFFGHSSDLIGVLDRRNRILFTGDAIINQYDNKTFLPAFLSQEFDEGQLLNTFHKVRNLKNNFDAMALSHYGVWTNEDLKRMLRAMEMVHFKIKNALLLWYQENPSLDYITSKYWEIFISDSDYFSGENPSIKARCGMVNGGITYQVIL